MVQITQRMEARKRYFKEKKEENRADQIAITCYTDPLCCWSWGFQPQLQQLLKDYPDQISMDYCMGGLIPDWTEFSDPLNSIHKPAQMGPMWMQASHLTNRKIDDLIWIEDPPSSSFPACIAVKTAQLQSKDAGAAMLLRLSEAVMENRKNVAKPEVIAEVAENVANSLPELLDLDQFKKEYNGDLSRELFRQDLKRVKLNNIGRFPTLTISKGSETGIMITGYRPYEALLAAVKQVHPL